MRIADIVALLNDHFGFHAGAFQLGQGFYFFLIHAGQHPRQSERHSRETTRRYDRRFGVDNGRNFFPDFGLHIVEHHKLFGSRLDGFHYFVLHQRAGHGRVGPGGIDERSDAQLFHQVAGSECRGGHSR